MIRYYCDRCEGEIAPKGTQRVKFIDGRYTVEIITGVDGVWNSGHLCRGCVIDLIRKHTEEKGKRNG